MAESTIPDINDPHINKKLLTLRPSKGVFLPGADLVGELQSQTDGRLLDTSGLDTLITLFRVMHARGLPNSLCD